jgi:hypothetical protein
MTDTTDTIETVAAVFTDVLGVEAGPDADFFELGGQSLQGIRIIARLEKLGIGVSVADLFDNATPRLLAGCAAGA